jgi:hypothetical protein
MMSYERWLNSILEVAKETASREFQQEAWLSGRPSTSSPTEIYNQLFDDYTFDLFYEMYFKDFTPEKSASWKGFKNQLESYWKRLESYRQKYDEFPNEQTVFDDPDWQLVREAAARFVAAFEQELPVGLDGAAAGG